jgi:GR25 family glycosyltransferase involved in LPS biosynthesis
MALVHQWPNILIVEDDMQWSSLDKKELLQEIQGKPWDVILLGGTYFRVEPDHRIKTCNTTTAYWVPQH